MAITLGQRQREFTFCIAQLVVWCYGDGYQFTHGDAYRDPRAFGVLGEPGPYGIPDSQHKKRLAIDLNLFIDGEYIDDGNHPAWKRVGELWEWLGRDINARWGGRYGDANHLEALEYDWRQEEEVVRPEWLDV